MSRTPVTPPRKPERARLLEEARQSANSEYDIAADWVDYEQAGVADAAALDARILDVLRLVDLDDDIYLLGLRGRIDPERQPEIAARIVEARQVLAERLAQSEQAHLVERFAPDRYNVNSSVGANLLFGTPIGPDFEGEGLARSDYVLGVLGDLELPRDLIAIGEKLARTSVELFSGMQPEHQFFEEFGLLGADELPIFERILGRIDKVRDRWSVARRAHPAARRRVEAGRGARPARSRRRGDAKARSRGAPQICRRAAKGAARLGRVLRSRALQRRRFDPGKRAVRHDPARRSRQPRAHQWCYERSAWASSACATTIIAVGLDYPVGTGGLRLSETQRQKIAIAVAILKRPDLVVFNDATAVLDGVTETAIIDRVKRELDGRSLICSLHRPRLASGLRSDSGHGPRAPRPARALRGTAKIRQPAGAADGRGVTAEGERHRTGDVGLARTHTGDSPARPKDDRDDLKCGALHELEDSMAWTILRGGRVLDIAAGTADFGDILIEGDTIREIGPPGLRRRPTRPRSRPSAGCSIPASSTRTPMATAISARGWATAGRSNCC